MNVCGIIAEFNPFHNGHAAMLRAAEENSDAVICILSGDFTQRGDTAIFRKEVRTKAALLNGADLVVELPVPWSMSGAENFATGGISLLSSTGIVNRIVFGSESGNLHKLRKIAEFISREDFKALLKEKLQDGITFAAARQRAAETLFPGAAEILGNPNDILATEYLKAAESLHFDAEFCTVKRLGPAHDTQTEKDGFCSASLLRQMLLKNSTSFRAYVPENVVALYEENDCSSVSRLYSAFLYHLRQLDSDSYSRLPEISEGIENRLCHAVSEAADFEKLLDTVKTKRYTMARIRRLVLSACIGLDASYIKTRPPYLRVLGFTKNGERLLAEIQKHGDRPLIIRAEDLKKTDTDCQKLFELESRIHDIYELSFPNALECGNEYRYFPVKG